MKFFLRFIEAAKRYPPTIKDDAGQFVPMSPEALERFWKYVEECQPFVFADEKTIEWEVVKENFDKADHVQLENAPFKVFSIEMVNSVLAGAHKNDHEHLFVLCAMCVEIAPMQWIVHCLVKAQNNTDMSDERVMTNVLDLNPAINMLLKKISSTTVGVESRRERIKIGVGKNKRIHTIRRIVHVVPKRHRDEYIAQNRIVSWTHRWWVRGHWRKTDGLGKDREGNYSVTGFTWVTEHVKGPDDAPIVKKVRAALDNIKYKRDNE